MHNEISFFCEKLGHKLLDTNKQFVDENEKLTSEMMIDVLTNTAIAFLCVTINNNLLLIAEQDKIKYLRIISGQITRTFDKFLEEIYSDKL